MRVPGKRGTALQSFGGVAAGDLDTVMNGSRELKSLRQVRDTENTRKHIFWSGYWLLGRFRAKNGGSQEPAKRRTFPIFAGTHRFSWSKIGDFALGHETI
jgi:hypothetical protein